MSKFLLQLSSANGEVSLESTEFHDADTCSVAHCHRGATTFRKGSGTFLWTQGVQALVHFFLEIKIAALEQRQGSIRGERGSLAASLDYSIAKNGQWLADMFGVYSDGTLRARRILRRTNPERKRPGPVEIFLNSTIISPQQVFIRCGNKDLVSKEELSALRDSLPSNTPDSNTRLRYRQRGSNDSVRAEAIGTAKSWSISPSPDHWLPLVLSQEISNAITSTDIFTAKALGRTLSKLFEDSYLSKHLPQTGGVFLWEQTAALPRSALLGLRKPEQDRVKAKLGHITIASSIFLAGAIGLLMYLRNRGLLLDIDYCFYRSNDILSEVRRSQFNSLPDGFVCSAASFPEMLRTAKQLDYVPLMLLPGVSSRIVTGAHSSDGTERDACRKILVIGDLPTSGSIYAHRLARNRRVGDAPLQIKSVNARLFEDSVPPHTTDFGLVLGFPTYHYHHRVNGARLVDTPSSGENSLETILFVKQSMVSDGRAALLNLLVRDAWLETQESPLALSQLITLVSSDSLYLKSLKRFGGFYRSATTLARA